MANDRLTWQNIAAPNFSDAIQASAMASRLMSEGLGSFGATAEARRTRMIDANSAEALMAAQQYTDPVAWQKAMAEGGIEGATGFDASRLNPDAITALGNRATDLFTNASTQATTAQTITDRANSIDENARLNLDSQNRDRTGDFEYDKAVYANDRARADDVITDAAKAQKLESAAYVDKIAATSVDQDAARTAIVNDRSLTTLQRQAHLAEFDAMAPQMYAISEASVAGVSALPAVAQTEQILSIRANDRMMSDATDDTYLNFVAAKSVYGNEAKAKQQLMQGLETNNGLLTRPDGETGATVTVPAGRVSDVFDALNEEFPTVPDSVIAHVVENNIKSDTWLLFLGGDGLEPNVAAARETLVKYADPATLATLEGRRASNEMEDAAVTKIKTELATARDQMGRAIDKGQSVDKFIKKIDDLEQRAAEVGRATLLSNGNKPKWLLEKEAADMAAANAADMAAGKAFIQKNAIPSTVLPPMPAGVLPSAFDNAVANALAKAGLPPGSDENDLSAAEYRAALDAAAGRQ